MSQIGREIFSIIYRQRSIFKKHGLSKNKKNIFRQITVCGDTHGQYYDLCNIFALNGQPSAENPYLFNGDFVDRGSWGLEVFMTLLGWYLHDPKCMYLTRGNHETKSMNELYGFEGEVKHKGNYLSYTVGAFLEAKNVENRAKRAHAKNGLLVQKMGHSRISVITQ